MTEPRLGLGPVARALVAGAVVVVTPPRRRGRCVTALPQATRPAMPAWVVTLSTPDGELPVLVPVDHKIYARVARRARRGDFWVVEADLVMARGDVGIRVRHLISSRDNFLPGGRAGSTRGRRGGRRAGGGAVPAAAGSVGPRGVELRGVAGSHRGCRIRIRRSTSGNKCTNGHIIIDTCAMHVLASWLLDCW